MVDAVAPRQASTVLLLRDSKTANVDGNARAEIEVFMMVRHHQIEFNSGALVFPGGSVDAGDKAIAERSHLYSGGEGCDVASLSFRIAGIRETFEESGILLARPRGSKNLIEANHAAEIERRYRAALAAQKTTFLNILAETAMVIALDALVPYAHWVTPEG